MPWGFITCGPNEALVVSGCCLGQSEYISGGRKFVWPVVQCGQKISLNTHTLLIESNRIYTKLGVPISVTGVAQVKIQGTQEMLESACQQFLGKTDTEIADIAKATLEGHQRAIMGNMTVEEIYKDRNLFSKAVFEHASSDLMSLGIAVVSYTLKDIKDSEGYLKALGLPRTSQVKRDARIGEAEARRDASIKEALAEKDRTASQLDNDTKIAASKRDFQLKQASYDMEVQTKKAVSDLAYALQAAKTKQQVCQEEMQIKVVERTRNIEIQQLEIQRRDRELDATVRKPADAERYRLERMAEADRLAKVKEAQAEAEALRLQGEAEAFALEAKAKAEAEQMVKKAEALKQYQDAARIDMILKSLPQIAAEIATPFSQVDKVTMVCSGANSAVGASKLTDEVLLIMEKMPDLVKNMTGVDITKEVKSK